MISYKCIYLFSSVCIERASGQRPIAGNCVRAIGHKHLTQLTLRSEVVRYLEVVVERPDDLLESAVPDDLIYSHGSFLAPTTRKGENEMRIN